MTPTVCSSGVRSCVLPLSCPFVVIFHSIRHQLEPRKEPGQGMTRQRRLEFAGALYHVTSRGNRREMIFEFNDDGSAFLSVFDEVCETFNWECHAYCLMGNHYHLLIETPDGNLSKGMRQLNGVYTQHFNRTHGRVGHVFRDGTR